MTKIPQLPISLIVITLNEEQNIQGCLRSVPWSDEKIVYDSGSTDETQKCVTSEGARFVSGEWEGFGKSKRRASMIAKNNWILSLDADERLSLELSQEIQQKFESLDPMKIYYFPRRSRHLGRWIGFGGWYPDYQPRLFHRQYSNWNDAEIHEKIVSISNISSELKTSCKPSLDQKFKHDLKHFVFRNLSHQVMTNDRYSGLQAQGLMVQQASFSLFKLVTKPWVKFCENYFWKQGFRDGLPGFIIAVGSAYSVFLKWAKLWELKNKDKNKLFETTEK